MSFESFYIECFSWAGCQVVADVCFVIDSSGSIRDNNPADESYDNWETLLQFIVNLTLPFDIGSDKTRVGLVKFSSKAHLLFGLGVYSDRRRLTRAILDTSYSGGRTNTSGGIDVMRKECFGTNDDRRGVPNIAFIVTDGLPTMDEDRAVPSARKAMRDGITIFSVGVTNLIDETFLKDISSEPKIKNRNWFTSPDFMSLSGVLTNIIDETCIDVIAPGLYIWRRDYHPV